MPSDAATSSERALVLVVDSDADTTDLYAAWLELFGLQVESAKDAAEAFVKACRLRPAVVVTELMLPGGGGLALIDRLRARGHTRDIPLIVVTGYTSPRVQCRIRDVNASAVLLKPCSLDRLLEEVRSAIARRSEPAAC